MRLPKNVIHIEEAAFRNCSSLTTFIANEKLMWIDESAFRDCAALKTVHLPTGITYIDRYTFENDVSLSEVSGGKHVTVIGRRAFANCANLKSFTPPNNIRRIESEAFDGCRNLTELNLPQTPFSIFRRVFRDTPLIAAIPGHVKNHQGHIVDFPAGTRSIEIPAHTKFLTMPALTGFDDITITENTRLSMHWENPIYRADMPKPLTVWILDSSRNRIGKFYFSYYMGDSEFIKSILAEKPNAIEEYDLNSRSAPAKFLPIIAAGRLRFPYQLSAANRSEYTSIFLNQIEKENENVLDWTDSTLADVLPLMEFGITIWEGIFDLALKNNASTGFIAAMLAYKRDHFGKSGQEEMTLDYRFRRR